jgi:hypothetical protein
LQLVELIFCNGFVCNDCVCSKFEVEWVSKTAAEQRKGRAGRTGPGHCYRLYSSAFYDQHMQQHQDPAILSTPLEDLLLQLKAMNIRDVESFPFPTQPSLLSLKKAQNMLIHLGALRSQSIRSLSSMDLLSNISSYKSILQDTMQSMEDDKKHGGGVGSAMVKSSRSKQSANVTELIKNVLAAQNTGSVITELGEFMSKFPVNPRFAKMIILAYQMLQQESHSAGRQADDRLLQLTIGLVCCLSEKSPFLKQGGKSGGGGDDDDFGGSDNSDNDMLDDNDNGE